MSHSIMTSASSRATLGGSEETSAEDQTHFISMLRAQLARGLPVRCCMLPAVPHLLSARVLYCTGIVNKIFTC